MASSRTVARRKYVVLAVVVGMLAVLLVVGGCGSDDNGPAANTHFAGKYSGTYAATAGGAASGTWTATVDSSGRITATGTIQGVTFTETGVIVGPDSKATSNAISTVTVGGRMTTIHWPGKWVLGAGGGAGGFNTVSGTWTSSTGESGTWSGSDDKGPAGNTHFVGPYSGTYAATAGGTDSGTWTATVDSSGRITATGTIQGVTFTETGVIVGPDSNATSNAISTVTVGGRTTTIHWPGIWVLSSDCGVAGCFNTVSGTWTSSTGESGTWTGVREVG